MGQEILFNKIWLIINDKEAEFEYFCKVHDLDEKHPMTFQMFKNEQRKVIQNGD